VLDQRVQQVQRVRAVPDPPVLLAPEQPARREGQDVRVPQVQWVQLGLQVLVVLAGLPVLQVQLVLPAPRVQRGQLVLPGARVPSIKAAIPLAQLESL